jgi:hypothetical protein
MSVLTQDRPAAVEQVRPEIPALPPAPGATDPVSVWERGSVWALLVVLFGAVVFTLMVVLTDLAGGPGYPY